MKNAIVLSGHYRSFNQIKENLKKFINENNLDVYFHLWSTDQDEINDVVGTLGPVKYLVEDNSKVYHRFIKNEEDIRSKRNLGYGFDKLADQASMYYARTSAYRLIEKDYDLIVFARLDLQIAETFKVEETEEIVTPTEGSWGSISDIFAIIPSKYAKHYFLYDNFVNLYSQFLEKEFIEYIYETISFADDPFIYMQNYTRYDPHTLLLRNLFINKVPFAKKDLPVHIQR